MRVGAAVFCILVGSSSASFAFNVSMFVPSRGANPCSVFYETLHLDGVSGRSDSDITSGFLPDRITDVQWDFIGPEYERTFGAADVAGMRERDPLYVANHPQHLAVVIRRRGRPGPVVAPLAWMRFLSNVPFTEIPTGRVEMNFAAPKTGVVPIEGNPGFTYFFQNYRGADGRLVFRNRVEPGRLVALAELPGSERPFSFLDMLHGFASSLQLDTANPVMFVGECATNRLRPYLGMGFRELTIEQIRQVSPDARFNEPGRHFIYFDVAEFRRIYIDAVEQAVATPLPRERIARLTAALERVPEWLRPAMDRANLEVARAHLQLGDAAAADAPLRLVEARGHGLEEIALTRLQLEIMRHFSPEHGRRDAAAALAYLGAPSTRAAFREAFSPERVVHPLDYYRAWVLLEAGRFAEAGAAVEALLPGIRPRGVRHFFRGGARDVARFELEKDGHAAVSRLTRDVFDPATGRGDASAALREVDRLLPIPPYGLGVGLRRYRASVLRALDRGAAATEEDARAAALPPPVEPL